MGQTNIDRIDIGLSDHLVVIAKDLCSTHLLCSCLCILRHDVTDGGDLYLLRNTQIASDMCGGNASTTDKSNRNCHDGYSFLKYVSLCKSHTYLVVDGACRIT